MDESRKTVIFLGICALVWGGIVLFRSSENLGNEIYERTVSDAQLTEAARAQLTKLQQRSFDEETEFCGLLAENARGEIVSRTVRVGDHESCDIAYFDVRTLYPLATYHTHAGYNTAYDSEVPSTIDIEGDIDSGMDGFVSTPGGRFWRIDAQSGTATQVCGEGCLPRDPRYRSCRGGEPEQSYTLATLEQRFSRPRYAC